MHDSAQVHAEAIVIDGHADTPQRFVDESWDFLGSLGEGMLNFDSAKQGNLCAEFFAIWVEPAEWRGRYVYRTLQLIDGVYEQLRRHPQQMRLGLTPEDIVQAHRAGTFCALMGLEGGHSIEADLALLRIYHRLGIRYMTLTWSNSNEWADSSGDLEDPSVQHHGGLTAFGCEVVREMNRLGMMVDISHVSDDTFSDVLDITTAPVIASHSCSRALTNAPRNLTDAQLRAVAKTGGIVMVNFYASFIDEAWRRAWASTSDERDQLYAEAAEPYRMRGQPVPYGVALAVDRKFYKEKFHSVMSGSKLDSLIDHFDHVARVAGIDHVGLGSDFDGFAILPTGIASAADLPKITAAMMARGYTAAEMKKILGGNLLRVFGDVQRKASFL